MVSHTRAGFAAQMRHMGLIRAQRAYTRKTWQAAQTMDLSCAGQLLKGVSGAVCGCSLVGEGGSGWRCGGASWLASGQGTRGNDG